MNPESSHPTTLLEAVEYFAEGDNAHELLVSLRWPNGPCCPRCGSADVMAIPTRKTWECKCCTKKKQFSVRQRRSSGFRRQKLRSRKEREEQSHRIGGPQNRRDYVGNGGELRIMALPCSESSGEYPRQLQAKNRQQPNKRAPNSRPECAKKRRALNLRHLALEHLTILVLRAASGSHVSRPY